MELVRFFVVGSLLLIPLESFAHSGGTDHLGCHHDRKNRDAYHCHTSKTEKPSRRTIQSRSRSQRALLRGQRLRRAAPEPVDALNSRTRAQERVFSRRSSREDVHAQRARNRSSSRTRTSRISTRREAYGSKRLSSPRTARDFRESHELVQVMRVIDGDTFEVRLTDGFQDIVRIVGIDTPELARGGELEQCYANEASLRLKRLLARKSVKLEKIPGANRDKYERLLRFVKLSGRDIGTLMLLEGYARTMEVQPHRLAEQYKGVERWARSKGKGLWGACDE